MMRHPFRFAATLLAAALVLGPSLGAAESKAVQQMAGILVNLNHFPSDAEKETLKKIIAAKETTAHERTVAQALLNVQHKVSAEDKPKLDAIVKDTSAPESVRTLATVVANLNHTPTAAEKEQLKKLASA